ncbi:hypothetical protein, partial [Carbonactinospora thermoautotrophica]|uniref:hypothetical protein n=1 Tax=Carbonactinospora thermoautotrophica TaxID=1469144 RepID=UPI00226D72DA
LKRIETLQVHRVLDPRLSDDKNAERRLVTHTHTHSNREETRTNQLRDTDIPGRGIKHARRLIRETREIQASFAVSGNDDGN